MVHNNIEMHTSATRRNHILPYHMVYDNDYTNHMASSDAAGNAGQLASSSFVLVESAASSRWLQ